MINKNLLPLTFIAAIFTLTAFSLTNAQTIVAVNQPESNGEKLTNRAIADNPKTAVPTAQTNNNYVRPTLNQRFKRYLNNTVGTGLIGVGIGAAIQQIADVPPEWENNFKGFARRFGSTFGENAIQETTAYGIESALKLDGKFYKSRKRDFGSRLKNALLSGVTARTPTGKRVFNPAPIIGVYTANLISTQIWYPKRYDYRDGLRQGTQGIGLSSASDF